MGSLTIECLPDELLVCIASFLSCVELVFLMRTCKRMWCIAQEDSLWKRLCEQHRWRNKRTNMSWYDWYCRKMTIEKNWLRGNCTFRILKPPQLDHPEFVYLVWWEKEEGKILLTASGATIRRWDVTTGELLATVKGHTEDISAIRPLDFDTTGAHLVSASQDGTIRLWRYRSEGDPYAPNGNADCVRICRGHRAPVTCVLVADGGQRLVSSSYDGTVRVWSATTGECLGELRGHSDWIWVMQLGTDGRTAVTGSDDATLRVWDIIECSEICVLQGHEAMVTCLQFECNADGSTLGPLVSGSMDGTLCVWEINKNWPSDGPCRVRGPVRRLVGHEDGVTCLCLREMRVVSGSADRTMRLWNVETGDCLRVFVLESPTVWCVRFDEFKAISGTGHNQVEVWSLRTGSRLYALPKVLIGRQGLNSSQNEPISALDKNSNSAEGNSQLVAEMGDIEGEEITIFQLGEETLAVGTSSGKTMFFNFGANVEFPPPQGRWNPFRTVKDEMNGTLNNQHKRQREDDKMEHAAKRRKGDSEDYPGPEPCQKCR